MNISDCTEIFRVPPSDWKNLGLGQGHFMRESGAVGRDHD